MAYEHPGITLAKLADGAVRAVYAPTTVAVPTKLDDIMTLATPYALKAGWLDFGATADSSSYERDMDSEEREIQQRTGAVLDRITNVERTITLPLAELSSAAQVIIEQGASTSISVGAAASGTPAQTRVGFGSISSLTRYRIALIFQYVPEYSSGEGGARGKFGAFVMYSAAIAAEGSEAEFDRDDGVSREITFKAYPESTLSATPGVDTGCFLEETGATVP